MEIDNEIHAAHDPAGTGIAGRLQSGKKEEPFQARHIRAGYDAGQVCQQLRQGWQEDGIAIPASQVSCHYLTVPLDYDKVGPDQGDQVGKALRGTRRQFPFADNSPRFSSWPDKPVRPHVKQETRTVKGDTLDIFYLHYRASGDYRGTLFYNRAAPPRPPRISASCSTCCAAPAPPSLSTTTSSPWIPAGPVTAPSATNCAAAC